MTSDNIYYDYQYSFKISDIMDNVAYYHDELYVIDYHLSFSEALRHVLSAEAKHDITKFTIIKFCKNNNENKILEITDLNIFDYKKYLALL